MLQSLLPRAHNKLKALPLLGPICDGFDDWLSDSGYTYESRRCAIHMLPHVDAGLRRRHTGDIASLAHAAFHACWRDLMKVFPNGAGTVRSLERYLTTTGMLAAELSDAETTTSAVVLSNEYADHLREVCGFAVSTVSHHRYSSRCFLDYLEANKVPLDSIQARDIEGYISQISKRLCRASLQHDIATVRGFLRFLATDGRAPIGVDRQIDTPRLYQMEKLPRALPWDTVTALLESIDTASAMGLRDYAMILLTATYGLRASEVVAVTLDDIRWRQGNLRIHQRKTSSPLELPLTNEVSAAIVKHLRCTPPPAPYRRIFLRMRAPMGLLKPSAPLEIFQSVVRKSGLSIPFHGPHCLRHSLAVHLLKNGTPLKTIGDIFGHRTAQSTSVYLRLATGDLREVSLAVPGIPAKGVR
jgi:integrase/recombinase XerD